MRYPKAHLLALGLVVLASLAPATLVQAQEDPFFQSLKKVSDSTIELKDQLDAFQLTTTGETTSCSQTPQEILDSANRSATSLQRQIQELEGFLRTGSSDQKYLALEGIRQANIRLEAFNDTLTWKPTGGDLEAVEWCSGFIPCLILRHSCDGCYNCYDGLIDCGCFNPCP